MPHGAEATANFFLLITVLLLRYSAAGWPGLWPLRPYLGFGATKLDHLELNLAQCKESFAWDLHRHSTHPHHFEQDRERLVSFSKATLLRLEAKLQPLRAESPWETAVRELFEHEANQRHHHGLGQRL